MVDKIEIQDTGVSQLINGDMERLEGFCSGAGANEIRSVSRAYITGTDYRWGIPYLMDVERYKEVAGDDSRMSDADTSSVYLSAKIEFDEGSDCGLLDHFTVFVSSVNARGDGWHEYDCIERSKWRDGGNYTVNEFKSLMKRMVKCIKGVDRDEVRREMERNNAEIRRLRADNAFLDNLIEG